MTTQSKWDRRFLLLASVIAEWSKDPSTKVGCVIVGPDREIVSTGFNGFPRGVCDLEARMERPEKYFWTSHAESNAVAQAARIGARLKGCTAYVTHQPCASCARSLVQAGIERVVYAGGKTSMPMEDFRVSAAIFAEAHVETCEYEV